MKNYTIAEERKNNRGRNLEFRYQVTPFDMDNNALDSEWVDTKQEAIDMAYRMFAKPRYDDVAYFMIYNNLNDKLSFKIERI